MIHALVTAALLSAAPPDAKVDQELPAFAPSPVQIDPRLRLEVGAGVVLLEQASRQRWTAPQVGVGLSLRPLERLRFDADYLFSFLQNGTEQLHVFNTFHAIRARLHYAHPIGGAWLTAGAGPVVSLTTSSLSALGTGSDSTTVFQAGAAVALGIETEVARRLIRFEVGAQSRGSRIDGSAGIRIGF